MAVEVTTTTDYPMIIEGEPTVSESGRWIEVRSPATGELVGRVPDGTEADVDRAVAAARAAFNDGRWSRMLLPDRVAAMNRLGDLFGIPAGRTVRQTDRGHRRTRSGRDEPLTSGDGSSPTASRTASSVCSRTTARR